MYLLNRGQRKGGNFGADSACFPQPIHVNGNFSILRLSVPDTDSASRQSGYGAKPRLNPNPNPPPILANAAKICT